MVDRSAMGGGSGGSLGTGGGGGGALSGGESRAGLRPLQVQQCHGAGVALDSWIGGSAGDPQLCPRGENSAST